MAQAILTGAFDDLRSKQVRLLQEASKLGRVQVYVWSDKAIEHLTGSSPKFPQDERLYLLDSLRYVDRVTMIDGPVFPHTIPLDDEQQAKTWVVDQAADSPEERELWRINKIAYQVINDEDLLGFPITAPNDGISEKLKVLVTGCYDWFHSGHVRFFEETAALGDLYVVVGHDENVRLLKGAGHPMFSQEERRYMVQSVRFVTRALVSSGSGWMDAEPEIERIKPDIYVVNEDGDQPEKREFCENHGLEYVVLKRAPKEGLQRRESTALRCF